MINESNFKNLLTFLGFKKTGGFYEKKFPGVDAVMSVSFDEKKLYFPDKIKGRERNNGFDKPENFVVFECVNRLLEKGYRPESVELEKEWHLGHDVKSGRADICVVNDDGSTLFIVECKTWGREFDKALNDTKNDGAQLFSYWQQEQACKWLALYASNFQENDVEYKSPTVDCSDDANITRLAQKDKSIKLYRDAHTTPEKYEAWNETYNCETYEDLIFSEDSVAYQIGVKPLLKKNLQDFTPEDKIVNKFEEILRHNNVSDKENAFNRLIALFICKLVDESTKVEEDEVEFQYKPGTDTYETLQDRLQRLHRDGMEKFMREEIYYVSSDYPEWLFSTYTGQKRKKAIEDLQNTIRILKFYSNNDFAFKDVHNEELFYQNGKILVEMVQLFEKYRIVYPSKHQFLGDLFEQLLNKGFKQNEGQFFTPTPITRFIWDSLPVARMVKSERGAVYPKVIDYACGAGHFLTEAVEAINYFAKTEGDNEWVKDCIYGIEKDYRLARVSKISLFMNGAGEGNIIFGDGLENVPDKEIKNRTFDILVSNPPYAVKDFKQHLQIKNNNFMLLDRIGLSGGEIETLFVERIGQLLKPQGVAAVILPSSILSNDSASYTGARELLLQNFYIRAIVALGSITFGETGTNTVVMFLEKFSEPPQKLSLSSDMVDAIFGGASIDDWEDRAVFKAYLSQNEIEVSVYQSFLDKAFSIKELEENNYFKMYVVAFSTSSEAKNLTKTKAFKKKNNTEQAIEYLDKFYAYAFAIEREKMFYFSLVYHQMTVVITAPRENKPQKEFLGYGWSSRKGNEGIQIITPGGKMYDDANREAEGTLADAIKRSFDDILPSFTDEQQTYASVIHTKDMLDFNRSAFKKTINPMAIGMNIKIESKYPVVKLENVVKVNVNIINPTEYPERVFTYVSIDSVGKGTGLILYDQKILGKDAPSRARRIANKNDVIISTVRPNLREFAYISEEYPDVVYSTGFAVLNIEDDKKLSARYLYYLFMYYSPLMTQMVAMMGQGQYPSINTYDIQALRFPLPTKDIQNQIVSECGKIDEEYNNTRNGIMECNNKIESLFNELDGISLKGVRLSLSDFEKFDVSIGKRVLDRQLVPNGKIPVYSANVIEPMGYIDVLLITDFSMPSILWGIDGDWMTNYKPENMEFYPTDHCGFLRCKTPEINPKYMAHILEREGKKMGFSRSYRASIDRIQGITFMAPDRKIQDEIIEKINTAENKLKELESALISHDEKILAVLEHFLL